MQKTKQPLVDKAAGTTYEQEFHLMAASFLEKEFAAVEEIIFDFTFSKTAPMQDLVSFVMNNRGKRLRPLLVLLCGGKSHTDNGVLYRTAAAVELIHTASLIHDDVIDGAQKRRGKPSLNHLHGNCPAVLTGDYFFARAFELVSLCENHTLIRLFTTAISTMCEGEIEQFNNAFNCDLDEEQYYRCAYCKTAVLLEACCEAGALLSGQDYVYELKQFGYYLGMAFQITDDLLDISGDPECTGKPIGSDLREGTITLPLIYVLNDPRWGVYMRELIRRRDLSAKALAFLAEPSCQDGPIAKAQSQAAAFAAKAVNSLYPLRGTPEHDILEKLAHFVLQRNK